MLEPKVMTVLGCMGCGSARLIPKRLISGPVTYEHEPAGTAKCLDCGLDAVPLVFRDGRELARFRRSVKGERANKTEDQGDP